MLALPSTVENGERGSRVRALKPLCIDLYCGLGGWAEGFLAEGYDVVGFDIERHDYGTGRYPGQLVLQDVTTLHGSQFRNAAVIVASPPCQFFSRMAMPFKCPWDQAECERRRDSAVKLFNACARISGESGVPIVIENVVGAQRWVGRAKWHFGSYYLWGDVPALMPRVAAIKSGGYSWSDYGKPDYAPVGFNTINAQRLREGVKVASEQGRRTDPGKGARFTTRDCGDEGTKNGNDWFGSGPDCSLQRKASSRSDSRKAASAQIAKIPFPLAQHIARVYKP